MTWLTCFLDIGGAELLTCKQIASCKDVAQVLHNARQLLELLLLLIACQVLHTGVGVAPAGRENNTSKATLPETSSLASQHCN